MKFLYRISIFFFVASLFLYIGIYSKIWLEQNEGIDSKQREEQYEGNEPVEEVSSYENGKITATTNCFIRNVNSETKEYEEMKQPIPEKYIGLNRRQLEEELNAYTKAPTLTDREKGFQSASLSSFSTQKIVIEKIYEVCSKEEDAYFFLVAEDNYIVVLNSDHQTVYERTNIDMDMLPYEVQEEILDTKYIADEMELYNFLESYSS